jgi:2-amino-4-hydroxy-6-hydroxymethyldihydropteridine diphosphokinase
MRAYIGLGSNLDNPFYQVQTAIHRIRALKETCILTISRAYQTIAFSVYDEPQPDYVNACVGIASYLSPYALLKALLGIEKDQGRVRTVVWGPRTLDLDLLWYESANIQTKDLHLPHPWMHARNTVLRPLNDIAPSLSLIDGRSVAVGFNSIGDGGTKLLKELLL